MSYSQGQLRLANLLLLAGVPLLLLPPLEDAARTPKLALFLVAGALLAPTAFQRSLRGPGLARWLALLYFWRALAPLNFEGPGDLRWARLVMGLVAVSWLVCKPRATKILLWVGCIETSLGLLQFLGLDPTGFAQAGNFRALGTLANSNSLCMFLLPLAIIAWHRNSPKTALWLLLGASLTGARAGFLAFLVSGLYLAYIQHKARKPLLIAATLIVSVVGLAQLSNHPSQSRSQSGHQVRLAFWTAAEALIETHPLGLGPAQFGWHYLPYRGLEPELTRGQSKIPDNCHNEWLGLGVEAGLPAMLLFLICLGLGWKNLKSPATKAALLALFVQTMFFRFSLPTELLYLYLLTGCTEDSDEGDDPRTVLAGLGLLLSILVLNQVASWCIAERNAWLAREAELSQQWLPASGYWKSAVLNCAPSRAITLRRHWMGCLIHLDPEAGEIGHFGMARLVAPNGPDPYRWLIKSQFHSSKDPRRARRALLRALLKDPWNREWRTLSRGSQR